MRNILIVLYTVYTTINHEAVILAMGLHVYRDAYAAPSGNPIPRFMRRRARPHRLRWSQRVPVGGTLPNDRRHQRRVFSSILLHLPAVFPYTANI